MPEVWLWRRDKLEIVALGSSGAYEQTPNSRLLPGLDVALLQRCVGIRSWQQTRQAFRAGLAKSK